MKKILFTLLLILAFGFSKAQLSGRVSSLNSVIFVDSVKMEFNTLNDLDTSVIRSMNTVNKNSMYDTVYVTLKDHNYIKNLKRAKKLSLKELTDTHITKADKGKPIIYIMDNWLLTDTAGVSISTEKFYAVKVTKAIETPYLKQAFPQALLFEIFTIINIRGNNANLINDLPFTNR